VNNASLAARGALRWQSPWLLALGGMALLAAPLAWGQSAASDAPAQAREVRTWLTRIHDAASRHNFQGTFIVSTGGTASSARIAHYCEGPNQFERSETLDGQQRLVYRHNDTVHTVWPLTKLVLIEQRSLTSSFPALLQAGDDRIADFYEVRTQGAERVAGRAANVLSVRPKDGLRYGYRLWADQASGLLLRADTIGERNEVLESSAFSEVAIDVRAQPDSVLAPMKRLDGYRISRPTMAATRLDAEGWMLRQPAPGFKEVSCVKRPMEATPASGAGGNEPQVLQAIYSDGLTYVSVFIEPFNAQRHTRPLLAAVGPMQTLMQQQGDWWVTVVGEVPAATLRVFAKALERVKR
jgi:sigma-E factor negative regulatory protein RseB